MEIYEIGNLIRLYRRVRKAWFRDCYTGDDTTDEPLLVCQRYVEGKINNLPDTKVKDRIVNMYCDAILMAPHPLLDKR